MSRPIPKPIQPAKRPWPASRLDIPRALPLRHIRLRRRARADSGTSKAPVDAHSDTQFARELRLVAVPPVLAEALRILGRACTGRAG